MTGAKYKADAKPRGDGTSSPVNDKDCHKVRLSRNPRPGPGEIIMELSDSRNRAKRQLPAFMYGATFPRDAIGSGGATYGGAQEWLVKHQDYMNQALRYVQRYPNLVEDTVMDAFWDFIEPLVYNNNLLTKYDEFLKNQFGFNENYQLGDSFNQSLPTAAGYFKPDIETRRSDYNYPIRRAFFCYDRSDAYQLSLKHLIVDQLEPFLSIRTNPTLEQSKVVSSMDICRQICGSVFIILINDNVLKDQICMNLLSIAISYKTPIIFLRESGYSLPADLPESNITYVKVPDNAPFNPKQGTVTENPTSSRKAAREKRQGAAADKDSDDVSMKALKERELQAKRRAEEALLTTTLTAKIKEHFASSLVFNTHMFETTLNSLYDKIAAYTGTAFPGEAPKQSIDAAAQLSKPFRIASMTLREKPIYKVHTARTTKGFHDTIGERRQLHDSVHSSDLNNNCNVDSEAVESEEVQPAKSGPDNSGNDDTASQSSNRATTGFSPPYSPAPPVKMVPAVQATVIESLKPTIMIPSPPKVMRSSNLSGQLTQPYYNGFRPSYPSNSKLLKYRPGSSRPSSARTRILLQSTLQKESDMEWD